MTSVKPDFRADELHAPLLMGLLFREVSQIFTDEDWGGLRQSHFRVISSVPPEGISVTALAQRVGMTKQGCGQFVGRLVGSGHLSVETGSPDRRVRTVRRTGAGDRLMTDVAARISRIEQDWAARVGERRYATFRAVLEELGLRSAR